MAMRSEAQPLGMLSEPELRTRLEAAGVEEAPRHLRSALGFVGLKASMMDPPPSPLAVIGHYGRDPVAMRIGEAIVWRDAEEDLDSFRIRCAQEHGGLGITGYYLYRPRSTR